MTLSIDTDPPSSLVIHSDRLKVEIAVPGTLYRRTRFDWTGFVTQVSLDDGAHTFCVPEDYDPQSGSGGVGLCGEFGIDRCIGFDEAQPGECFPKPGIGLLIRPDESPYDFFHTYEIAKRFPIQCEAAENRVRFTVDPLDCRGYALRQTKTLSVEGSFLQVDYQVENAGRRAIHTNEYCHNFAGIDRQLVGLDYRMRFPYPLAQFEQPSASVLVEGCDLRWQETPTKQFYCRTLGYSKTDQPQWELRLQSSGVGMREYDDFAPARVAVWGNTHVVSAEIFVDIHLEPGQSQSWTRRYEFFS